MSFFEPPPPPSEPPRERPSPSWAGAPTNEIGSPVPLRLVLARTEQVAVVLVGGTAYTTGVVLGLAVRSRRHASDGPYDSIDFLDFPFGSPHRRGHPPDELPDDLLRFGVEFSDGGRATTVGGTTRLSRGEPTGPLLMEADASMSEGTWDGEFWLWPLPPPGPLTFAVEWPSEGLPLTKHEVDASLFTDASKQSEVLWPESGSGEASASRDTVVLIAEGTEFGAHEPEGDEDEESPSEPGR